MLYPSGHILHPPVEVRDAPRPGHGTGITIGALSPLIGHKLYLAQGLPDLGPNRAVLGRGRACDLSRDSGRQSLSPCRARGEGRHAPQLAGGGYGRLGRALGKAQRPLQTFSVVGSAHTVARISAITLSCGLENRGACSSVTALGDKHSMLGLFWASICRNQCAKLMG